MEIGFWDYTCPLEGSIEQYTEKQYINLLDDMKAAGMDSFVLGIKWLTTGYYSKLPFLDQDPSVTAIASKNEIIKFALREARARGITTRLLIVCNIFQPEKLHLDKLWTTKPNAIMGSLCYNICDIDQPGLKETVYQMFDEIIDLFGDLTDGLIVELEYCDKAYPHRIPLYDDWAKLNSRPSFADISKIDIEPRSYPFMDWRDFATERRTIFLNDLLSFVRDKGFKGHMATIYECFNGTGVLVSANNLDMLYDGIGKGYDLVTYDCCYTRKMNHDATIEMCMKEPMKKGFKTFFITRGVLTFADALFDSLTDEWDLSIADAISTNVDGLWFMGADCAAPGVICTIENLWKRGFKDGLEARRELLSTLRKKMIAAGIW